MLHINLENWHRTIRGYKSTAGTTATIAIIRNGILYTGHVGDSGILLLYIDENNILQSEEITKVIFLYVIHEICALKSLNSNVIYFCQH